MIRVPSEPCTKEIYWTGPSQRAHLTLRPVPKVGGSEDIEQIPPCGFLRDLGLFWASALVLRQELPSCGFLFRCATLVEAVDTDVNFGTRFCGFIFGVVD